MASNIYLIVLVLVSISVTSVYSLSTRDAVFKHDDESYLMATSDQGSSIMIEVEDLAKGRSLQALVAGSKVVVKKAVPKSTSTKSSKKKKHKGNKAGSLDSAIVGIIIAAVVITIVIICVVYFFYLRHKTKKDQSIGQATEKINESSETQTTSKTEDHV